MAPALISRPLCAAFALFATLASFPAYAAADEAIEGEAAAGVKDVELGGAIDRSEGALRLLEWIAASGDNGDLPYIVIDKNGGVLHLFDQQGDLVADAPVLIGTATGDDASPGIGAKKLSEIGPAEKTTPAGRFLAKIGWAAGDQKVLWVDYATSVALHAVVTGNRREKRLERLASPDPEDNRITFGCINVPVEFYEDVVRTHFEEAGGIVYVLPDTRPLEEVFPRVRLLPYL